MNSVKTSIQSGRMIFLTSMVITMALVMTPASIATGVQAFVPTVGRTPAKQSTSSSALMSTKEDRQQEQQQQQQEQTAAQPTKFQRPDIRIAPLGGHEKFGRARPLKEFPTYEMKERFKKIRSPRKSKGKPAAELPAASAVSCPPLLMGSGEFFATEELTQTLREKADVGNPLESSRTLADQIPVDSDAGSVLSCGSASCTPGGWPSKEPQCATEVFYCLSGFGCLTDTDGTRHYFGPGDTVIVPKNWAGRRDVAEDLHTIWFVLHDKEVDEKKDEENDSTDDTDDDDSTVVKARVIHYHELVKYSFQHTTEKEETMEKDLHKSETKFTTIDDELGIALSCITAFSPTSKSMPLIVDARQCVECFYVLEGAMVLTPACGLAAGGSETTSFEIVSGDTVVLPQGWTGTCKIREPIKALRVQA